MTWVLDRGGRVVYRANWTGAANAESFVDRYLAARAQLAGVRQAMYETEQIEFRRSDPAQFTERLRRNGQRAADEFEAAKALWARRNQR